MVGWFIGVAVVEVLTGVAEGGGRLAHWSSCGGGADWSS